MPGFIKKHKSSLLYGVSLAALLFLLKWLELRLVIVDHLFEIYIGAIAAIFTGLGIWLALKFARPKVETIVVEKQVFVNNTDFVLDKKELDKLNLSRRELDVLELMAKGMSNQEIANRLFVSLNTIKTHTKNLFEKLDVNRRTQAIDKARKLNIIP